MLVLNIFNAYRPNEVHYRDDYRYDSLWIHAIANNSYPFPATVVVADACDLSKKLPQLQVLYSSIPL